MRNYSFINLDGQRFHRISKRQARRIWAERGKLIAHPVNLCPTFFGMMAHPIPIETMESYDNSRASTAGWDGFDYYVTLAEYYNCNSECGYYMAFYTTD